MEEPDVLSALAALPGAWRAGEMATSYVLDLLILVPAARPGMPRWQEGVFGVIVRLSGPATEYFRLPPGRVVELGSPVEI
jgi:KUP system potassium uptake protein